MRKYTKYNDNILHKDTKYAKYTRTSLTGNKDYGAQTAKSPSRSIILIQYQTNIISPFSPDFRINLKLTCKRNAIKLIN